MHGVQLLLIRLVTRFRRGPSNSTQVAMKSDVGEKGEKNVSLIEEPTEFSSSSSSDIRNST